MYIKEALDNIIEKKLDLMKENLESALTEKVIHILEERKIEIAQGYFAEEKGKNPAKEGSEAAKRDDDLRKRHMEKYGKLPKRLTGELAVKFMNRKSKGQMSEMKNPAKEGSEAAMKDDELRKRHMEKYGKLPKRLTGELAVKFMNRKSKGK